MSNLKLLLEVLQDARLDLPSLEHPQFLADQLSTFLAEWALWNGKINLTSEKEVSAVIKKHIFDSLQYVRAVTGEKMRVMDIGSGAGFPGIPLKVLFPSMSIVLVESQRKRANFLRNCVRKMELGNVDVLNRRAEEISSDYHDQFDLVLFRGVGEISHCLALAAPFVKMGGQVSFKKEPKLKSSTTIEKEGWNFQLQDEIAIRGYTEIPSKLVLFQKRFT